MFRTESLEQFPFIPLCCTSGVQDYNSSSGRFLSEDPIGFEGQDSNLYRYTLNNPLSFIDFVGFQRIDLVQFLNSISKKFGRERNEEDIRKNIEAELDKLTPGRKGQYLFLNEQDITQAFIDYRRQMREYTIINERIDAQLRTIERIFREEIERRNNKKNSCSENDNPLNSILGI